MNKKQFSDQLEAAGATYHGFLKHYQVANSYSSPGYIPIGEFLKDYTLASEALSHSFPIISGGIWAEVFDKLLDLERDEKYRKKYEGRWVADSANTHTWTETAQSCTCSVTALMREGCPRLQGKMYCHEGI